VVLGHIEEEGAMAENDDLAVLASRCSTWETAELVRATTDEASNYTPESLAVFRRELERRGATEAAPPRLVFSSFTPENDSLRGVGGWLVWMILGIALSSVLASVEAIRFIVNGLTGPNLLGVALDAAIAILGLLSCVMLVRQRPNADRIALGWFILNVVLVGFFLAATLALGRNVRASTFASSLAESLIWITYLRKSERVRLTYRSPRPQPEVPVEAFD
jgi:hypothetical protein